MRIAQLVAEGLSNPEIAERLFISRHTVESHLKHIFTKLRIGSRVELATIALRSSDRG
jgi:DNA-binding CsgD family transcriptional regulator